MQSAASLLALKTLKRKTKEVLESSLKNIEPEGYQNELKAAQAIIQREEDLGVEHLGYFDKDYPELFRALSSPPLVLRFKGNKEVLKVPQVAIVGTRKPTNFGLSAVEAVVKALSEDRWGIVSGLALGIDSAAHRAALSHNLPTVAILGCGVENPYPRENKSLAEDIIFAGGALISECACGTRPQPRLLVARNRLQVGLSRVVFVAQSAPSGGAMYAVRFAIEQGRPIWCPQPNKPISNDANLGLSYLLEVPANEITTKIPPLASLTKSRLSALGNSKVARPLSRTTLEDFIQELRALLY